MNENFLAEIVTEKQYTCLYCPESFHSMAGIKTHMKEEHNIISETFPFTTKEVESQKKDVEDIEETEDEEDDD